MALTTWRNSARASAKLASHVAAADHFSTAPDVPAASRVARWTPRVVCRMSGPEAVHVKYGVWYGLAPNTDTADGELTTTLAASIPPIDVTACWRVLTIPLAGHMWACAIRIEGMRAGSIAIVSGRPMNGEGCHGVADVRLPFDSMVGIGANATALRPARQTGNRAARSRQTRRLPPGRMRRSRRPRNCGSPVLLPRY